MADLSFILDRAMALAAVAAPMVILVALLLVASARASTEPGSARQEEDPAPRWQLDRR